MLEMGLHPGPNGEPLPQGSEVNGPVIEAKEMFMHHVLWYEHYYKYSELATFNSSNFLFHQTSLGSLTPYSALLSMPCGLSFVFSVCSQSLPP